MLGSKLGKSGIGRDSRIFFIVKAYNCVEQAYIDHESLDVSFILLR